MRLAFNRVALVAVSIIVTLVVGLIYLSGYRFSSLQAAKAHFDIGKSATNIGEVNLQWGKVYLFDSSQGPRTVLVTKVAFLWRAPVAVNFPKSSDSIQTVGWVSFNDVQGQVSVFAVETSDPTISYIELGPTTQRIKKEITVKDPVIFSWNKVINFNDLNPVALSKEGRVLYEYRYPKNTTTFNIDELKWYAVSDFH